VTDSDRQKQAAALRYDRAKEPAPRVLARGRGAVAEEIIRRALAAGVAVHEDPDLVAVLVTLEVESLIPVELYQPLAEILAFVYAQNRAAADDGGKARNG